MTCCQEIVYPECGLFNQGLPIVIRLMRLVSNVKWVSETPRK